MAADKDATLEQAARQLNDEWAKGGTAPDPAASAPPPPAPPPPAPAPVTPPPATVQTRGTDGRFGPRTPSDAVPPGQTPVTPRAPADATPAVPTPPAPGATAAEVQDYIEAMLGEGVEPLRIPRAAKFARKVQGETDFVSLDDLLRGGMREQDYIRKTMGVAARQRELEEREADIEARNAQFTAREAYMKEQEKLLRDANTSQEGYEAFQQHLRAMETNPRYRQMVEDALSKRETDARVQVYEQREHRREVAISVDAVQGWVDDLSRDPRFTGVDAGRVLDIYAAGLRQDAVALDRAEVERIFEAEAQYLSKSLTPLQQEVAELRAQVAAITGQQSGAQRHNAQTAHAVQRGGAMPTKPVGGSPPAPAAPGPVAPFTPRDLPDRNREWANRR